MPAKKTLPVLLCTLHTLGTSKVTELADTGVLNTRGFFECTRKQFMRNTAINNYTTTINFNTLFYNNEGPSILIVRDGNQLKKILYN